MLEIEEGFMYSRSFETDKKHPFYVFIDGQNVEMAMKTIGLNLDYQKFYDYLKNRYKAKKVLIFFRRSFYLGDFYDELRKIGYIVRFCIAHNQENGRVKANIDTLLVVDAVTSYYEKEPHNCILVSGDGDFLPLVNFYERKNHYVGIISVCKANTSKFPQKKAKKRVLNRDTQHLSKNLYYQ